MDYKHIIFDIDGTLIDTKLHVLLPLQRIMKDLKNIDMSLDELSFAFGITSKDALLTLGFKDDELGHALNLISDDMAQSEELVHIYDGITDVLMELKKRGYILGIVTSRSRIQCEQCLLIHGLRRYFDVLISKDDTASHKPNAEPILKYLELANAKKEESIYIGDSSYDMLAAANAGIDGALAMWGQSHTSDGEDITASYYLKGTRDILSI